MQLIRADINDNCKPPFRLFCPQPKQDVAELRLRREGWTTQLPGCYHPFHHQPLRIRSGQCAPRWLWLWLWFGARSSSSLDRANPMPPGTLSESVTEFEYRRRKWAKRKLIQIKLVFLRGDLGTVKNYGRQIWYRYSDLAYDRRPMTVSLSVSSKIHLKVFQSSIILRIARKGYYTLAYNRLRKSGRVQYILNGTEGWPPVHWTDVYSIHSSTFLVEIYVFYMKLHKIRWNVIWVSHETIKLWNYETMKTTLVRPW